MAKEVTFKGRLVAKNTDWMNYTTYVFEDLEFTNEGFKYIMCTQFPNWEQSYIMIGDIGFVSVRYVKSGIDTWFDGTQYTPYKNTDVHFIKFVPETKPTEDVVLNLPNKQAEEFLEINLNE